MLIENSISTDKLSASIVGIGLNLNQRGFSSELTNPTSLIMEKLSAEGNSDLPDKIYDRKDELSLLLGYIFTAYSELEEGYCKELEEEYHRNLYRLGEFHRFIEIDQDAPADIPVEKISRGKEITARILGTDEYGCAIMEHISGEIKHYPFKGIRYVL